MRLIACSICSKTKFELLARHPGAGVRRSDIGPDVRSFPLGNYLVLYRRITDGVEIIRAVHEQRDLSKFKLS